jgi:hypothetical protein
MDTPSNLHGYTVHAAWTEINQCISAETLYISAEMHCIIYRNIKTMNFTMQDVIVQHYFKLDTNKPVRFGDWNDWDMDKSNKPNG